MEPSFSNTINSIGDFTLHLSAVPGTAREV